MKDYKVSWLEKIFGNPWYGGAVILGILGIVSLFQINSYWADKHHFNGVFGWLGIGIVLLAGAVFCIYKTSKTSSGIGE